MGLKGWIAKNTGLPSLWTDWRGMVYRNGEEWWEPQPEQVNIPYSLPLSPIGVPVTYRQGGATFTLTRTSAATIGRGAHMLTTIDGHTTATFRWVGDDEHDMGVDVYTAKTSQGIVSRWPLMPPERTFTLECLTDPEQTRALEKMISQRTPLLLHHDKTQCQMNPCDIEPVRAIVVTKAAHARTRRAPVAQRRWNLTCSVRDLDALVGDLGQFQNALTWGDWDKFDHSWQRRSYMDLCRLITGMPA